MKIIVAGDFCPVGRLSQYNNSDITHVASKDLCDVIHNADFSIVNLECPIADENDLPIIKDGPNLKCTEFSYSILSDLGFDAVTLANNHLRDFGDSSIIKTINKIDKLGIEHVGGGQNLHEASKILYYPKDGKVLAVINCCEHESSIATKNSAGANGINVIQQYYDIKEAKRHSDYVLVIVHGGHEHFNLPSPRMQETYRFFIDVGADAVVNHHQHCYSGYEEYNGKYIFYGIGNFLFDNIMVKGKNHWNSGYLVLLDFDTTLSFDIIPYLQSQDDPFIRKLTREETEEFKNNIKELNNIIQNSDELVARYHCFLKNNERRYEYFATPYFGKLMGALYRRGLLPKFVPKKKLTTLINYVNCESHLDFLRMAFDNNMKK